MRKSHWYIINNDSHEILRFTSEKKLREYAKAHGFILKHSPHDYDGFYIDSYIALPS